MGKPSTAKSFVLAHLIVIKELENKFLKWLSSDDKEGKHNAVIESSHLWPLGSYFISCCIAFSTQVRSLFT